MFLMDTGQIQLGAYKGSVEFSDQYSSQGFFYGGSSDAIVRAVGHCRKAYPQVVDATSARQAPNFSDNLCHFRDMGIGLCWRTIMASPRTFQDNLCRQRRRNRIRSFGDFTNVRIIRGQTCSACHMNRSTNCLPAPFCNSYSVMIHKAFSAFLFYFQGWIKRLSYRRGPIPRRYRNAVPGSARNA